jgi:hypothetical protein
MSAFGAHSGLKLDITALPKCANSGLPGDSRAAAARRPAFPITQETATGASRQGLVTFWGQRQNTDFANCLTKAGVES